MAEITKEKVERRLNELRQRQLEALTTAAMFLGRIQECEILLAVLDKEEAEVSPSPKLVEVGEAE